jgi:hypothetical protein
MVEENEEEYEVVEFTKTDSFWYEIYEPVSEFIREFASIAVEAMWFALKQNYP